MEHQQRSDAKKRDSRLLFLIAVDTNDDCPKEYGSIFFFLTVMYFFRALMDCLVLPIQNKLEEWKKITQTLDKEHAKGSILFIYAAAAAVCLQFFVCIFINRVQKVSYTHQKEVRTSLEVAQKV